MKIVLFFGIIFYFFNFVAAQSSVVLNWVDTSNSEIGFGIERAIDSGTFSYLSGVNANIQTYTDSTVHDQNSYSYRVYSWNFYGNSTYSNIITVSINSQEQGTQNSNSRGGSSGGLTVSVIPN
jgi:hypothetical protein